ncbi:MAG TPA: phosphoribosylanthranilate isomerase [Polyangiales bacterium]
MASLEEAQLAVSLGVDAVGFVAARPASPRTIADATIAAIAPQLPRHVASFLLTSETTAAGVARHVSATHVSTVQLLAYLSAEECRELARLLPNTQRVQVIHVEAPSALELIDRYAPYVQAFLLDSGRPTQGEYGGTGRTHDWQVSAAFVRRSPHPVFLAGGLSAANVVAAMHTVRPYGVDLCSGVRTHGRLDREKLAAFVDAVRTADATR